ncbi:MAG: hypothetical protein GF387_03455, partial [Candidatus Portnoybacteria bacterium]|nr:hypothetical protein [Candidatus Portnoybacteria bacterium]
MGNMHKKLILILILTILLTSFFFIKEGSAIDCPSRVQTISAIVLNPIVIYYPEENQILVSDNGVNTRLQGAIYQICDDETCAPECLTKDYCKYFSSEIVSFEYKYDIGKITDSGNWKRIEYPKWYERGIGQDGCLNTYNYSTNKYRFSFVLSPTYTKGEHTLYLRATDEAVHYNPAYTISNSVIYTFDFTADVPDTTPPVCQIDYPDGWITTDTFNVTLTESDDDSGIKSGNVDIKSKYITDTWPSTWSDYTTTIDSFDYTGDQCHWYQFRYQVEDNAGNLSQGCSDGTPSTGFCWEGKITKIDKVPPTADISY